MKALIGHTGFVGQNLARDVLPDFRYNSKTIDSIRGMKFDELIVAGAPGLKWYANQHPKDDLDSITNLIQNLSEVQCDKVTLISTIDVFGRQANVVETDTPSPKCMYGEHRLMFENFVLNKFMRPLIVRLPGVFGEGLKKNIIFDFMHNNRLEFIDSRGVFQFYSLANLNADIIKAQGFALTKLNIAPSPVSAADIYLGYFGSKFENRLDLVPANYAVKSIHSEKYGGLKSGYFNTRDQALAEILAFMARGEVAGVLKK